MKETIAKRLFFNAAVCPTLGWRIRANKAPNQPPTLGGKFHMEQGVDVGTRARCLFPQGVLISKDNVHDAAVETAYLMRPGGPSVLFEATFLVDDYVAKADVLQRNGDTWQLVEVKSNTVLQPKLTDDLAYTFMVLSRAGVKISKASLMLLSKDFRLGMEDAKLFSEYDRTKEAAERASQFQPYWDRVRKQTSAVAMPKAQLIKACKDCELFKDCLGKDIENHIFEIPRLSAKKLDELTGAGIFRIEAIPQDFELTPNQERIRQTVVTGKPWVGPDLQKDLSAIKWPAAYLDFETVVTTIPLYPAMAPYTQVPTQYSIHRCSGIGTIEHHAEYLADPTYDSRRNLTEALIADLKGAETIVTYSNFEKTTVTALGTLFPDLAGELDDIKQRMFDLEAVIRENYYHPAFHGRTSVKATLPALVPDMSYAGLNIHDGDSASATFAYMAMNRYNAKEIEDLRKDLLVYCGQDTLAMVKLHERLYEA